MVYLDTKRRKSKWGGTFDFVLSAFGIIDLVFWLVGGTVKTILYTGYISTFFAILLLAILFL